MTFNDVLQPNLQLLKSNIALSLNNNLIFENWEKVELFMDTYSEQHGFENKKVRTEKDKDGQLKKCRFDCKHSGKHKPKKSLYCWHFFQICSFTIILCCFLLTVNLTTVLCSIDNEDCSLYNIINQWVINKQLVQQSVDGSLI